MKQLTLLGLLALMLAFSACDDDDDGFQFDPELMHYDGANANAPFLPTGNVEVAAQFRNNAMDFYRGKRIDAVQLFIYDVPESAKLILYGQGNGDEPGPILYQQEIADDLDPDAWNTIPLTQPLDMPDDELWIGLQLPDGGNQQVIGCDSGPAQDGGDWMYQEPDEEWRTFRERSTDNINWNIRASVTD
jgi:hypothetical protein